MVFGDEIRSAAGPSTASRGIGGAADVIWHCDNVADSVYELSITDFSVDREAASPGTTPIGIGGDSSKIWHCDYVALKVYELSVTDFSVDREAPSIGLLPYGIGGDSTKIWHCDSNVDWVMELSTTDFSEVRGAFGPSTASYGIGGSVDVIWHCDAVPDKVYELSLTDFSVVREAGSPDITPYGIGGDRETIWHCDPNLDKIYELDAEAVIIPPTVSTQDASDIGVGQGKLHGTIVSTGGENADERGFDWDYDSGAPYAYEETDVGSFGVGVFEKLLTGLTSGETVYYRAKAHNSEGWGYGAEKSFVVPFYEEKIATFSIAADGIWTDYDLFTLQGVPKGAVAEIVCCNKNEDFARICGVRTDGSGLNRYIDLHEAEGLGVTTATMFVKCHATTGLIECYAEIQGDVDFVLLGYFSSDVDFTEAITNLGNPGLAWADLDLTASGVLDDAVVQILMGNEAVAADFFAGVRANGSGLERGYTLDEAEADGWTTLSMVVQSDAGAVIEWKGGSVTDVTMWLLGWFSSNVSFTEGFTDYSPAADSTWTEKTIAEAAASSVIVFALVHQDSGAETFCGLRADGSALARMIEEHEAEGGASTGFQACVQSDSVKKCEVFCEDASEAQFGYTGYFVIIVVAVGWTGKISGVTNPAKIMGVPVANIAKVKGVASA